MTIDSPKRLAILGSTGSIGKNVLDVVNAASELFTIVSLAAACSVKLLASQAQRYQPKIIAVLNAQTANRLKALLPVDLKTKVVYGSQGYLEAAIGSGADIVLSAMVGIAGLLPTFAAISAGINVALANKEALVAGGELIMAEARKTGAIILPVDSEHSAIFQTLMGNDSAKVRCLLLTASGGPLWKKNEAELKRVTPYQALNHPNWKMGPKISIDSSTLMNKGLEVIEASWLFSQPIEKIRVLIHPQSVVHSLVEYVDGSIIAQLGIADMRLPIAFALFYPERRDFGLSSLDLTQLAPLTFELPDLVRFPALKLAYQAARIGGTTPAVLSGANEVAVNSFLADQLDFPGIVACVASVLDNFLVYPAESVAAVLEADHWARIQARSWVNAHR